MDILNTRVLVFDSGKTGLAIIRECFQAQNRNTAVREPVGAALGDGQSPPPSSDPRTLDCLPELDTTVANSRAEVLVLLRSAVTEQHPFALICLPDSDASETVAQVRGIDPNVEVMVLDSSDDSAEGATSVADLRRRAFQKIVDWNQRHNLDRSIASLGRLRSDRDTITTLLQNQLDQVASWVGTSSLLVAEVRASFDYAPWLASGAFAAPKLAERMLASLHGGPVPEHPFPFGKTQIQGIRAGKLAAFWEPIAPDKVRHLGLILHFLEQASQAVERAGIPDEPLRRDDFETISNVIGTIVHDLRAPIGAIQSALDVALMSTDDSAELWEMLEIIGRSAEEAMATVGDIIDLTQNATIDAQTFLVEDLLDTVRDKTRELIAERPPAITISCEPKLQAHGDARKLERALINLVNHAAKNLVRGPQHAPAIKLSANAIDGMTQISIADNGPGIPPQIQATLFEPFSTQGPKQTGHLHLGPAIAKQIVASHGGTLTFTTNTNGTTFLVSIPTTP